MLLPQGQTLSPMPLVPAWGIQRVIKVPNPAEGTNWSVTVPGGFYWSPVAVRFVLKAGVGAAKRIAGLSFFDGGGNRLLTTYPESEGGENVTQVIDVGRGLGAVKPPSGNRANVAMPFVALEAGWSIESRVQGLEAKDQLETITVWVEQYEIAYDELRRELHEDIERLHRALEALRHG